MVLDTKPRRFTSRLWANGLAGLLGLALAQCGAGPGDERTATSRQAIVDGTEASASGSPVLYLKGPQGTCTSVLIAPTLIATARHCTADLVEGSPACTAEGTLATTGSGAGEIGADDAPGSLSFFSAAQLAEGGPLNTVEAVGVQILSTQGSSICSDDLAFVVLDHAIAGVVPASIRLSRPTEVGELVSVFGYGLTEESMAPTLLRVRENAQVLAVGPGEPTAVPQAAPLRSLRIGPGVVTCNGDSGGPVMSMASGAVIGLVSLGTQASKVGPFCNTGTTADTTGPELSEYQALILLAFEAAGASPILEMFPSDAGIDSGRGAPDEAGSLLGNDAGVPSGPVEFIPGGGGSCATVFQQRDRSSPWGSIAGGLAMLALAVGRRRRRR
jgi:MYXO-CTERM domain-containing protein